jgi:hypothetical protein
MKDSVQFERIGTLASVRQLLDTLTATIREFEAQGKPELVPQAAMPDVPMMKSCELG